MPEVPLVVVTHGLQGDPAALPPRWPVAAEAQLWRELQADLAGLVQGGEQVIAERSGHYIHQSQPELVVDAIRSMVVAVRDTAPAAAPAPRSCVPT